MQWPSLTFILCVGFAAYIGHSMWALAQLFGTLHCSELPCFTSYLASDPKLQLVLFISTQPNPQATDVTEVAVFADFDYMSDISR